MEYFINNFLSKKLTVDKLSVNKDLLPIGSPFVTVTNEDKIHYS